MKEGAQSSQTVPNLSSVGEQRVAGTRPTGPQGARTGQWIYRGIASSTRSRQARIVLGAWSTAHDSEGPTESSSLDDSSNTCRLYGAVTAVVSIDNSATL